MYISNCYEQLSFTRFYKRLTFGCPKKENNLDNGFKNSRGFIFRLFENFHQHIFRQGCQKKEIRHQSYCHQKLKIFQKIIFTKLFVLKNYTKKLIQTIKSAKLSKKIQKKTETSTRLSIASSYNCCVWFSICAQV